MNGFGAHVVVGINILSIIISANRVLACERTAESVSPHARPEERTLPRSRNASA